MAIARNHEWKHEYGYSFTHVDETIKEEVVDDNTRTANVLDMWVTSTGGHII